MPGAKRLTGQTSQRRQLDTRFFEQVRSTAHHPRWAQPSWAHNAKTSPAQLNLSPELDHTGLYPSMWVFVGWAWWLVVTAISTQAGYLLAEANHMIAWVSSTVSGGIAGLAPAHQSHSRFRRSLAKLHRAFHALCSSYHCTAAAGATSFARRFCHAPPMHFFLQVGKSRRR